jgi:predicted NBD/HSP70 family sugar kinase
MHVAEGAQPSLLRAINLRATFEVIRAGGPVGAPHVVREARLSRPTVGEVISQLLDLGLIRKAGLSRGLRGPGAQMYDVNPRAGWVLSVDVGREWLRAALSDLTGAVVVHSATRTGTSARAVIVQVAAAADALAAEAGITRNQLTQVVVGTPGVIRPGDDHLSLAPQLAGWERPRVLTSIREHLEAPVVFENDVKLSAVGEHVDGIAKGSDDFVLISLGTGIGMAAFVEGALRRGASGLAGEIGYLPLKVEGGRPHAQGSAWGTGAFERMVTSSAISGLAERSGLSADGGAAGVFTAARQGDARALRVVEREAERLAYAVATVAAVLDPELVVLGGGIGAGGGDLLLPLLRGALTSVSPFSPRLEVSTLGAEAVIAGAKATGLRIALDRIFGADTVAAGSSNGARPRPWRSHESGVRSATAAPG